MPSRFKIINLIEQITSEENGHNLISRLRHSKKAISTILEDEDLAEELLDDVILNYEKSESFDLEKILDKKEKKYYYRKC